MANTVLDTTFIGQDGQVIHPVVANTAKDGSGTWYVALLDADGKIIISPVAIAAGTALIGKVGHDKSGIGHGVTTVTTAGTDVVLAASTTAKVLIIQSQTDNTGVIAIGASGVDATVATGTGVALYAGDSAVLEIDNLADIFVDATVSGEGVRYTYLT